MWRELPRKKGINRFIEVFLSEFREFIKLNLLFIAVVLPSAMIFFAGLLGFYSGIALILSLIVAFPIGGAISACMFCVTGMLRDEPGHIWGDFKRKFKENVRQAAAPGILCAALVYAQVYLWGPYIFGGVGVSGVWLIPGLVFLLIFGMIAPYFFLQVAYLNLKTKQILINSVILSFSNAPRSFMGAVTGSILWAAVVMLLPESLAVAPLLLLFGFSVSWLLCLMWIWPPVNKQFNIEEILRDRLTIND